MEHKEVLALKISSLSELFLLMLSGDLEDCDWSDLPTFGGDEPEDTMEVWSWDEDNLLIGSGSITEMEIIPRTELRGRI